MSDLDPNGMFGNLDDPTPPAFGGDLLPGVLSRGHQIRKQRRTTYAVGSACAAVLVAGAAIGAVGTNSGGSQRPDPAAVSASPSPSASHTPKAGHHTTSPVTTSPNHPGSGGKPKPPTCDTPTPTTSEQPTPSNTGETTPTETPTAPINSPTSTPTADPTDTTCPSSSPTTTPSGEPTTSPTSTESSLLPGL